MKKVFILIYVLFFTANTYLFSQQGERQLAISNYNKYASVKAESGSLDKLKSFEEYREFFSKNPYRLHGMEKDMNKWRDYSALLNEDGYFSDLKTTKRGEGYNHRETELSIVEAFNRIWCFSELFRNGNLNIEEDNDLWIRMQKAIVHYGGLEIERPNASGRFHSSCFALPTSAVNIYFAHMEEMDKVESGEVENELLKTACDMLKTVGLQAWTQPLRNDFTDENVVQIERFRNHVWWVGGNAIGYRSLLPVAFMVHSVPMVDLLSDICQKGISVTSQHTYNESFWTEGFTADGAGWGHGMQCLIWGYPIDGTLNALNILSMLQDSPWEKKLSEDNVKSLMNFFRGSNYYYYKGFSLPCVDRYSMTYNPNQSSIRYQGMINQLLTNWSDSFTSEEIVEMKKLKEESKGNMITMDGYDVYNGTRWFYNNDDLIKKNDRYHVIVNMASIRVDGLESAHTFADAYNYYTTDGATMFQKTGNEYRKAFGAFDVTAFPGVTAREGMDKIKPVTNWVGYTSKHNFAGAATNGGENAVAGYIFEKMDASDKGTVNDLGENRGDDEVLYGVKAYKSYFMLGDYMVALGAGITNKTPEVSGRIRTTIDQTELVDSLYVYKGNGVEWIVQNNKFAYSALPKYKNKMHYVHEKKATDWIKMNPSNKGKDNLPESVDILRLWIDHGDKPINDTYGYVVYCGDGLPDKKHPFKVLRNDTLIQSVSSLNRDIVEAVFYDSNATLEVGKNKMKVSAPCVVLIEQNGSDMVVSVTDPLMDPNCKSIEISWRGKSYVFDMPQGANAGQSTTLKF